MVYNQPTGRVNDYSTAVLNYIGRGKEEGRGEDQFLQIMLKCKSRKD